MTKGYNSVQSVERALDILELVNKKGNLKVSEISKILGLDRSTTYRIATTLKQRGFLSQDPSSKKYQDSFKLFTMGHKILRRLTIHNIAYPYMMDLMTKTNESVTLSVLDKVDLMHLAIVEQVETPTSVKVAHCIGNRAHSYTTAMGKIMLSSLPDEDIRTFFSKYTLELLPKKTTRTVDDLISELRTSRERGYATEHEEYMEGLNGVAAQIKGTFDGGLLASIGISFLKSKYEARQIQCFTEMLKMACDAISQEF